MMKTQKMNSFIDEVESQARILFNKVTKERRKPSDFELTNLLNIPEVSTVLKSTSVMDVFDDFIESNKSDKAKNTIKGYTTIKNFLIRFQDGTNYTLTWENMDVKFIDKLKKYTYLTEKKQLSYYAKITRVLSTFLHWSEDRNYYHDNIYPKLKSEEAEKEVVFLSMDDLMVLMDYKFEISRLQKVRDLYCFASFTGLRYSDVVSLKREHINNKMLTKTQVKTGYVKMIPLNDFALKILKKYEEDENPLPRMSIQKINDYIKECCKAIALKQLPNTGFNVRVIKKTVIGSETTEESLPLHEAITFHTARKTFITNSIMLGVNIKALQDMGAPKKEKDLRKYLKITDAFKSQVMDNTWNVLSTNHIPKEIISQN